MDNTTTAAILMLRKKDPDIIAGYNKDLHEVTAFLICRGVLTWDQFQRRSDRARKALTMRKASYLDVLVSDPTAPKLATQPTFAVVYDRSIKRFLPAVNCACVLLSKFYHAEASATAAAAEANLFAERNGRLPQPGEMPTCELIYPGSEAGTTTDPGVIDLLGRINS